MAYEFLEHTGDARMRVRGGSQEELFVEAMRGMFAYMEPRIFHNNDAEADRVIRITAPDATALLIDFLGEALGLALANNELYEMVRFMKLSETALEAELYGRLVEQYDREIKAVTYHGAMVRKNADGAWETEIVFDI